jgi:hypothetical protein
MFIRVLLVITVFSQTLPERDLAELVSYYKTFKTERFQREMPPVTDPVFRASIYKDLLPRISKIKVEDSRLLEALKVVLKPVLSFYGREYDIFIINDSTPILMSASGVALVVSTGMIKRARSDDELLGYVAHEVGHEFFSTYSIYSKYLLRLGNEPLNRQIS